MAALEVTHESLLQYQQLTPRNFAQVNNAFFTKFVFNNILLKFQRGVHYSVTI
jgi:hypothetical protein